MKEYQHYDPTINLVLRIHIFAFINNCNIINIRKYCNERTSDSNSFLDQSMNTDFILFTNYLSPDLNLDYRVDIADGQFK